MPRAGVGDPLPWLAPWLVALLVAVAQLLLPCGVAAQQWSTAAAQPLVDAVYAFGASNSDSEFVFPADSIVSLDPAIPFTRPLQGSGGQRPFTNGTLLLRGLQFMGSVTDAAALEAVPSAVLDTRMRTGLVPTMLKASLNVTDVRTL